MVKDPVCGMEVDPKNTSWSMEYHGAVYYFYSEKCLNDFTANPERYLNKDSGSPVHDHGGMGGCCGGGGKMGYLHIVLMILFFVLLVVRNL